MSRVVLVDPTDREIGTGEKLQVHRDGALHRAFSLFVFRSDGRMLLQRRAPSKYHSGGLWSNTCCSHPLPGEGVEDAARRRLSEEMGMECALHRALTFVYRARVGPELCEHELLHVFVGRSDARPRPDDAEVSDWRDVELAELVQEIAAGRERFTVWFPLALHRLLSDDAPATREIVRCPPGLALPDGVLGASEA